MKTTTQPAAGVVGSTGLSALSGKRVTVVVTFPTGRRVFRGTGEYARNAGTGNELCIEVDRSSVSEETLGFVGFVFHEESWRGEIVPDTKYGTDYVLNLRVTEAPK
ncbi:MAG: hypothetical protein H8E44_29590 [Planctomycetes bacterium]|nr:hypothetical protein [Planctomycetota bacterium]MBL7037857.1 hypothetical protein [Pirellulaceae bacterium]